MKKQVLNDENKMTEVVIVKLSLISQIEVMQVISENWSCIKIVTCCVFSNQVKTIKFMRHNILKYDYETVKTTVFFSWNGKIKPHILRMSKFQIGTDDFHEY